MLQAPDHWLWLASYNGLARFDGLRFEVFSTANSPGLESKSGAGIRRN